jgi:predicted Rossmann-fold nucleotide-binding protein
MKYKIGVFGSGGGSQSDDANNQVAQAVGQALGNFHDHVIIITGGCTGLPYVAAREAKRAGCEVWGFSPVLDMEQQKKFTPDDDLSIYTKLQFVPKDMPFAKNLRVSMKYRNVLSTAACDAGIIISGRWGSLNEFTNLVDMQKLVGVVTGTGGIADELPKLDAKIHKQGAGKIVFNDDPIRLIEEVMRILNTSKTP